MIGKSILVLLKERREFIEQEYNLINNLLRFYESAIETAPIYKNPDAMELGRRGGLKGGKARAASLSSERRREIAQKAANAKWEKHRAARSVTLNQ